MELWEENENECREQSININSVNIDSLSSP